MKIITIKNWTTITNVECNSELIIVGPKIYNCGSLSTEWTSIKCSCDRDLLNSNYFNSESSVVFGEAASAVDRALELAFTRVNDREEASFSIQIEGCYIDDSLNGQVVAVSCVGLYKIEQNGKRTHEYSAKELLSIAQNLKNKSSKLLSQNTEKKTYALRISSFYLLERSVKWSSLISPDELEDLTDKQDFLILQNQCYNNFAHLYLTFEDFKSTVTVSSLVIKSDESNIKALYRRAVANTNLQNYELASKDLQDILSKDPANIAAKKQIQIIDERQCSLDKKYAKAMQKFLFSS